MAKLQSSYFVCFAFSIFVNLLFVLKLYVGGEWELSWSRRAAEEAEHVAAIYCSGHGRAYLDGLVLDGKEPVCECNSCYGGPDCSEFLTACAANADREWELSWSRRAAEEAEYVAAISCSGHGKAYLDGLTLDGKEPVCECSSCYGGPHCSEFLTGCAANAGSGDPLFLEPFWMQHASKSALVVAGWHRMSYTSADQSYISAELERHIRKLHAIVGNAVTGGRYIVFGAGSTQLLNAAVHALSSHNSSSSSSPASVVASIPYYNYYQIQMEFFHSRDYVFRGDASLLQNISDATNVIEFVTSPNNPDGQLNKANVQGPNAKAIYDRVYYWPHFTAIPTPANDDIMIFAMSKLTGHAGSRFGWAVVKDESVFEKMTMYTLMDNMGISRDAQLRALKVLNVVLEGGGKDFFEFGYNTMRKRWEKLSNILSVSNRFSLQKFAPKYCTFFKKTREPSPAYAWVKCEREEDKDCYAVLQEEANVYGLSGSQFGAEDRFVRLALIRSQDDFDLLLQRLNQLVSEEKSSAKLFCPRFEDKLATCLLGANYIQHFSSRTRLNITKRP